MPDVAKRLVGPVALPNTTTWFYTTPANTTTIVRSIHVATLTSGAVNFSMTIGGGAAAMSFFNGFPVPGGGALDWSGFLVLHAGDVLQMMANAANMLVVTISGVEVS